MIKIAVSLIPVFGFLVVLVVLDSFKLVKPRSILAAILVGCAVAGLCLVLARWLLGGLASGQVPAEAYSKYAAPVIEEVLKAGFVIFLIVRRRIGFMVDAAILGFAVGAGFAFIENIYYLRAVTDSNLLLWTVRGLGTAVMHGGTTAAFAVLSQGLAERGVGRPATASSEWRAAESAVPTEARNDAARASECPRDENLGSKVSPEPPVAALRCRCEHLHGVAAFLPGLAVAIGIHSLFNHFVLPPVANTVAQMLVLPAVVALIFNRSERALRDWLEVGLDTDVRILEDITTGTISETKPGRYLESLRTRFPGEVVADMLCLLRIHMELAARAKGILLMRQAGFSVPLDPEIKERLTELKFLEKSIGATGRLALAPILHGSSRDLWQLYVVGKT